MDVNGKIDWNTTGKERKANLVRVGLNYHRIQSLVNDRIRRG